MSQGNQVLPLILSHQHLQMDQGTQRFSSLLVSLRPCSQHEAVSPVCLVVSPVCLEISFSRTGHCSAKINRRSSEKFQQGGRIKSRKIQSSSTMISAFLIQQERRRGRRVIRQQVTTSTNAHALHRAKKRHNLLHVPLRNHFLYLISININNKVKLISAFCSMKFRHEEANIPFFI